MFDLTNVSLFIGIVLIIFAYFWERFFYQKQEILLDKLLYVPPPLAANIPPHIKHSLKFYVPKSIRIDESAEMSIEYIQGVFHPLLPGNIAPFLFDTLDSFERAADNLRGLFFASTRVSDKKNVTSKLTDDFAARLSSPKFAYAPVDWIVNKKGLRTPLRWRWTISCNELGKYKVVVELNDAFRSIFTKELSTSPQVMFDVEVRSPYGLTIKQVHLIKSLVWILTTICRGLFAIGLTLLAFPSIQTYLSSFFP